MQIVQVAGGDLFRLANQYLGDATQWVRIALLNGIADPWLQGPTTLRIPDRDPNAGGGVARQ